MKKILQITAFIMLISISVIFADSPTPLTANFTVSTMVGEVSLIKITTANTVPTKPSDFTGNEILPGFSTLTVNTSGNQGSFANLAILSNQRGGYKITMTATAMASTEEGTSSYIDYIVACGNQSVTTKGSATPIISGDTIVSVASLSTLTGDSKPISVSIDSTSFNAAVAGTYSGTVTFTIEAN